MSDFRENPSIKTILTRQSVREYEERPIAQAELQLLAEAALRAPSARNTQPCHIRFLTNKAMLVEMNKDFKELVGYDPTAYTNCDIRPFYHNAPLLIQLFAEGNSNMDGGIMCENICLAAWAMGLGSCIIGSINELYAAPIGAKWKKAVNIPENYVHLISIAVGYPHEIPPMKPRFDDRIEFIG